MLLAEPPLFDFEAVKPGEKLEASLIVRTSEQDIALPVLVAKGAKPGKTLVVSAGVHGDEYEGVQAIFDIFREIEPQDMAGSLLAVPVSNPPAFWNLSRVSPLDQGNLARVFPGEAGGPPTTAIAYHFDRQILSRADFYVDLHSSGVKFLMPTLVGYHAPDIEAGKAAAVFGAPVIWRHPAFAPGRTVSAANARGIPSLYVEARGAGRIDEADLQIYRKGIRQLLRHLRIVPEPVEAALPALRLCGDGNIDGSLLSTRRGFLTPCVQLLEQVARGQKLGVLRDIWGRSLQEFFAPEDGTVVLIHACPLVQPDEPLFLLTDRE